MRVLPIRYCADVEASIRFYRALGLELGAATRPGSWVELPAAAGLLALHKTAEHPGSCELAFEADEPLEAVADRLRAAGLRARADRGRVLRPVPADHRPRRRGGPGQRERPLPLHVTALGGPGRPRAPLAAGVIALEFAAAVTTFVSARRCCPRSPARSTRATGSGCCWPGPRWACPWRCRWRRRCCTGWGRARTLLAGLGVPGRVGGLGHGRLGLGVRGRAVGGGLGGGLLAVFGVTAVIRELDEELRARVVATSSAMWILPAFVGAAGDAGAGARGRLALGPARPAAIVLAGRLPRHRGRG